MAISFVKMHGLGNDFVVLDGRGQSLPPIDRALASAIANRHTGIGCDQLIVLEPSAGADLRMRIFNPDGGEVEACGNATRAVGLLLGQAASIETLGGRLSVSPAAAGIAAAMGRPRFGWQAIPLAYAMDTLAMPVSWEHEGTTLESPVAVNVGNPHVIFFVADADAVPLAAMGPVIELDPLFPERVNVNVASVLSRRHIRLRVWERGAGLTRACGTGACATAIAAMRRGLVEREVTVSLPGGDLVIGWGADDGITMTGPASEAFRGQFDPAALTA
ncbi:MAG TPA: diaminopimelate epimerase [Novosphingobium sp.]|nr:diaminopimelate epimerase [Novosphingobium sp.]